MAALWVGSRRLPATSPPVAIAHCATVRTDPVRHELVEHPDDWLFQHFVVLARPAICGQSWWSPETFSGAACCRLIELPTCEAAPLQARCESSCNGDLTWQKTLLNRRQRRLRAHSQQQHIHPDRQNENHTDEGVALEKSAVNASQVKIGRSSVLIEQRTPDRQQRKIINPAQTSH